MKNISFLCYFVSIGMGNVWTMGDGGIWSSVSVDVHCLDSQPSMNYNSSCYQIQKIKSKNRSWYMFVSVHLEPGLSAQSTTVTSTLSNCFKNVILCDVARTFSLKQKKDVEDRLQTQDHSIAHEIQCDWNTMWIRFRMNQRYGLSTEANS